jgi:hypothetical protein
MYEIIVPGSEGPLVSGDAVNWLNGGLVLLLAASAFIAAGGAVFPTKIKPVTKDNWYKHYQALAASLVLASCPRLLTAWYTMVYLGRDTTRLNRRNNQ